jgi:hypothetical protein
MSNNRETSFQLIDLPEDVYTKAMPAAGISNNEMIKISKNLSLTCRNFYSMFEEPMTFFALKKLLHAVVDDDQKTVKKILNCKLEILLITPPPKWIITSQLTGDEYSAKDALMMACQLRQTNMIKLLISYYKKMPQNEIVINKKTKALTAWPFYQIEKNRENEEEIIIPDEYISYIESLMRIFLNETFEISFRSETSQAILSLTEKLQKKQFDTELLLLAVYKVFTHTYFNISNDEMNFKVEHFCANIMSKVQAAVLPDSAKILCLGLDYVGSALNCGKKLIMTPAAENFLMKNGFSISDSEIDKTYNKFFYCRPPGPNYKPYKLGGKVGFFCGLSGERTLNISNIHYAYNIFHDYLKHKQQVFINLCKAAAKSEPILPVIKF